MLGASTSPKRVPGLEYPRFISLIRSIVNSGVSDIELKPLIVLKAGETPGTVIDDENDNDDLARETLERLITGIGIEAEPSLGEPVGATARVGVAAEEDTGMPKPSFGLDPFEGGGYRENGDGGTNEGLGTACSFALNFAVRLFRKSTSAGEGNS